jgi:hypothetical protein
MTDKSLDLALGGPKREMTVAGKTIELVPMKMKQLAAFSKAIQPIKAQIAGLAGDLTFANIADLLAAGDDLFKAVEIASGVDRKTLEDMDAAQFIELAGATLTVNADFFVQRVAPALKETAIGSM